MSDGADVPGTTWLSDDEEVVYFTPDSSLSPSTSYTATLSYCGGDSELPFTTSALGSSLTADLVGKTYSLDLGSARFIDPPGVGDLLGDLIEGAVLIGVKSTEGGAIEMFGTYTEDEAGTQDFCMPTFVFPSADFSDAPYFSVGPADTTLSAMGYSVLVHDLQISGTFAADGSYFGGAVLGGAIDARDIVEMIDEVETAEDACALTESFGAPCVACSDGEEYCLELLADQIKADEVAGVTLEEIEEEDTHPNCKDAPQDTGTPPDDTGVPAKKDTATP